MAWPCVESRPTALKDSIPAFGYWVLNVSVLWQSNCPSYSEFTSRWCFYLAFFYQLAVVLRVKCLEFAAFQPFFCVCLRNHVFYLPENACQWSRYYRHRRIVEIFESWTASTQLGLNWWLWMIASSSFQATIWCDIIVLYCLKDKNIYRNHKYHKVENENDPVSDTSISDLQKVFGHRCFLSTIQ